MLGYLISMQRHGLCVSNGLDIGLVSRRDFTLERILYKGGMKQT
jgi:hypothetical protein